MKWNKNAWKNNDHAWIVKCVLISFMNSKSCITCLGDGSRQGMSYCGGKDGGMSTMNEFWVVFLKFIWFLSLSLIYAYCNILFSSFSSLSLLFIFPLSSLAYFQPIKFFFFFSLLFFSSLLDPSSKYSHFS